MHHKTSLSKNKSTSTGVPPDLQEVHLLEFEVVMTDNTGLITLPVMKTR